MYAGNEKEFKALTKEYEVIKKAGFTANLQQQPNVLPFKNAGFLEIPQQAKFHPIKFAKALADLAEAAGAKIFTDSKVLTIKNLKVTTDKGQVTAKDIVMATYAPFTDEGTRFKKGMYVSYVHDLQIPKNVIPEGLYLDMQNPYHYAGIDSGEHFDRMIVGGEDHRKDIKITPEKNFQALAEYAAALLGSNTYTILRQWHGPILESVDGLAFIGAIKPHLLVATAFSGNGMTYAPISSVIVRDLILGQSKAYSHIYNPQRIPTLRQLAAKGFDFAIEFFGGAFKNYFHNLP